MTAQHAGQAAGGPLLFSSFLAFNVILLLWEPAKKECVGGAMPTAQVAGPPNVQRGADIPQLECILTSPQSQATMQPALTLECLTLP